MVSKALPQGCSGFCCSHPGARQGSDCGDRLGDHGAPSLCAWAAGFGCQISKQAQLNYCVETCLAEESRASPGCSHTHTHTTFCSPHFCSTASTCPHNPNPGLKTKQGWRGKKGQMDSTLLLRAWSNLHCYNSSSWDSQKNTFNISFFSCFFPTRHFSLS